MTRLLLRRRALRFVTCQNAKSADQAQCVVGLADVHPNRGRKLPDLGRFLPQLASEAEAAGLRSTTRSGHERGFRTYLGLAKAK